jgi:hypothetical protein
MAITYLSRSAGRRGQIASACPLRLQRLYQLDQIEQRPTEPIELPGYQHVTGRAARKGIGQPLAAVPVYGAGNPLIS